MKSKSMSNIDKRGTSQLLVPSGIRPGLQGFRDLSGLPLSLCDLDLVPLLLPNFPKVNYCQLFGLHSSIHLCEPRLNG